MTDKYLDLNRLRFEPFLYADLIAQAAVTLALVLEALGNLGAQ